MKKHWRVMQIQHDSKGKIYSIVIQQDYRLKFFAKQDLKFCSQLQRGPLQIKYGYFFNYVLVKL